MIMKEFIKLKIGLIMIKIELTNPSGDLLPRELEKIRRKITDDLNFFTFDLKISIEANYQYGVYCMILKIHFERGQVASLFYGDDYIFILTLLISDIKNKLNEWTKINRMKPFLIDQQTQNDAFELMISHGDVHSLPLAKVLLVEDDPIASSIITSLIRGLSKDVVQYSNPFDAEKNFQKDQFDLIIVDWNLPFITGGELLSLLDRKIYRNETLSTQAKFRPIPAIVCSIQNRKELNLPDTKNIKICDFWDKSEPLTSSISRVVNDLNLLT